MAEEYSIRCIEIGDVDCPWVGHGRNEDEVMRAVEDHGREQHNIPSLTEEIKNKVRQAMRKVA